MGVRLRPPNGRRAASAPPNGRKFFSTSTAAPRPADPVIPGAAARPAVDDAGSATTRWLTTFLADAGGPPPGRLDETPPGGPMRCRFADGRASLEE